MAQRLGIIAGSGDFPLYVLKEAKKQGYFCALTVLNEGAAFEWESIADVVIHAKLREAMEVAAFFRSHHVDQIILAGKIDLRSGIEEIRLSPLLMKMTAGIRDRRPAELIALAIEFFAKQGIRVVDPMTFVSALMCEPGVMTAEKVPLEIREELDFGWPIARAIADLDVGQTVIVKDKTVVTVEGIEGTDETIRRGGRLTGGGFVAIKLCRTRQDARIDLPAVGMETIRSLLESEGRALCFEARRMPFFQREEALRLAEEHGITVIAHEEREPA